MAMALKKMHVYQSLLDRKQTGKKSFAVLIDPDKVSASTLDDLVPLCVQAKVDYFFVGGSLVTSDFLDDCIRHVKNSCDIPVLLFPGSPLQLSRHADDVDWSILIGHRVLSGRVHGRSLSFFERTHRPRPGERFPGATQSPPTGIIGESRFFIKSLDTGRIKQAATPPPTPGRWSRRAA